MLAPLAREIAHWKEVVISLTIFAIYVVVYRFILYRLPILYAWKEEPATVKETVTEKVTAGFAEPAPVKMYRSMD